MLICFLIMVKVSITYKKVIVQLIRIRKTNL
jgi:hypothetical protein